MSVAKIDMIKGVRSPEEIKKLADVVQKVILQKFNAPPRDRYVSYAFSHSQDPSISTPPPKTRPDTHLAGTKL
jgi:hypothetical protein